ncbi:MAG: hypothetical protein QXP88_00320 [Thermoproteota archaeon]
MPFPNEIVPSVSPDTNLFVFKDTTNNFLYLCIGSTALGSSRTITSRSQLPLNTKCAALIDDASTGINSSCPSPGNIYPEKSYVTYNSSSKIITINEATVTNNANCSYVVTSKNVDLNFSVKSVGEFTMRVFYTYNGGYHNSSLSGLYNVSNLWEGYDPTFPNGSTAAVSPYGIGYLLLDWYWPGSDPNVRVVLSFSSPVAGKGLGFATEHHQGGNLSPGYFSNTVTVTSTSLIGNATYTNAIVLKLTVEPGGANWYGWGTVTASFYNVANLNTAYPVYSIPVFVKYLN